MKRIKKVVLLLVGTVMLMGATTSTVYGLEINPEQQEKSQTWEDNMLSMELDTPKEVEYYAG